MLNSLFKTIMISILVFLFFSGCNSEKYEDINKYNEKEFDDYLREAMSNVNNTLPRVIDDIRMGKISIKEKEIIIKLIILYADKDKPNKYKVTKQIKKDTVHNVCNNSNSRIILKKNYSYKYTYFTDLGHYLGSYVVFEKDCF